MSKLASQIQYVGTRDGISTAVFFTDDVKEVNLLRRAIMSEIETYTINVVLFHRNKSARQDEVIALRLGQLPIDHTRYKYPGDNVKIRINVEGPLNMTTDHIPEIPFSDPPTPILTLREGEYVVCDVIVEKGTGAQHIKWRPISTIWFDELDDGRNIYYEIKYKGIGMMPPEEILEKGINKMDAAAVRPVSSRFSNTALPDNYVEINEEDILSQLTLTPFPDLPRPPSPRRQPMPSSSSSSFVGK